MNPRLRVILELAKIRISALSTLSAATGHLVFARTLQPSMLATVAGVFLLAMGSSSLNQWQEREFDARMARTRNRPLPTGRLDPPTALGVAILFLGLGFAVLFAFFRPEAGLLGVGAVAWYNAVYTPLKRRSAFAVVPGALIGAIPPILGWTAGGGEPFDPHALGLAFFFFVWQVPHFWLLLFNYGEDYAGAGFPTITRVFTHRQLARLTWAWMVGTVAASLLLRIYGITASGVAGVGLAAVGLWLLASSFRLVTADGEGRSPRRAFRDINLYVTAVMAILALDALV